MFEIVAEGLSQFVVLGSGGANDDSPVATALRVRALEHNGKQRQQEHHCSAPEDQQPLFDEQSHVEHSSVGVTSPLLGATVQSRLVSLHSVVPSRQTYVDRRSRTPRVECAAQQRSSFIRSTPATAELVRCQKSSRGVALGSCPRAHFRHNAVSVVARHLLASTPRCRPHDARDGCACPWWI